MPQVEWPSKRHKARRFWAGFSPWLVIVAMVVMVLTALRTPASLIRPAGAGAVSSVPDNAPNSDNMNLVISESSNAGILNAPHTYVKIYLNDQDTGTVNVNIWNAPFNPCNKDHTAPDWYAPTILDCSGIGKSAAAEVDYKFYAMDSQEDPSFANMTYLFTMDSQTGAMTNGRTTSVPASGWSGGIGLDINKLTLSQKTGYYVVVMVAEFKDSLGAACTYYYGSATSPDCSSRLHSFQLRATQANDYTGYWEAAPGAVAPYGAPPDGEYAVHVVDAPGVHNFDVNHTIFKFAPSCDMKTPTAAKLKWFDADWQPNGSLGPWYISPKFVFSAYNGAGTFQWSKTIDGSSSPTIGGNNVYREYSFTAQPGWKYVWEWDHMNGPFGSSPYGAANNIQMWLPFDSINYNIQCFDYHDKIVPIDGRSDGDTLDFSNPADLHVAFRIDASNLVYDALPLPIAHTFDVVSPVYGTPDLSAGACASVLNPNWPNCKRDINTLIVGRSTIGDAGAFAYNLNPLTPDKTVLCFNDHITPHLTRGDPGIDSDNTICYHVKNQRRYPAVVGLNSDVHAGGGPCPQQNPGKIQGDASGNAQSYGQYVVSAANLGAVGGTINAFGSDNSLGSNKLNLGKGGNYAQVCRLDLYAIADSARAATPHTNLGAGSYVIDNTWHGVYYATGPISIKGTVSHPVTIVLDSGDMSIYGDLMLDTAKATDPRQVPVLGIITNGPGQSVYIEPQTHLVDAYMFSDGTIDTCATSSNYTPAGCDNTLVVNGFLVGKTLNLKRLGPNSIVPPSQIGEQLELVPQLYLTPPTFFDASGDATNPSQGLGEKPPLF